LIRKYEMNMCLPDEIDRAKALIAKRANRKRNRTDAMLETEEQKEKKRLEVEAQAADRRKRADAKRLESAEWAETLKRAEEKKVAKAEKLDAVKLEIANNLAKRDSIKRDEEIERVAAAKEAADKLAAGTNYCTERASSSKNEQQWDDMFEVLVRYIEEIREMATRHMDDEHKAAWFWDGNVPTSYKTPRGKALGMWIKNQRSMKAKDALKDDREVRLTSTGLRWRMI